MPSLAAENKNIKMLLNLLVHVKRKWTQRVLKSDMKKNVEK